MSDTGEFGLHANWVNCEGGVCCTEALAIMEALVAERDEANVQWHKIRDLHADAVSEVQRLREAAGWLIGNRGHRGEEQAWKLLADALDLPTKEGTP